MKKVTYLIGLFTFLFLRSFAQTPTALAVQDTRYTATTPSSYSQNIQSHFKWYTTVGLPGLGNGYYSILGIRGGADNSVGKAHELSFSDDNVLRFRSGYSPTWEGWRKVITEDANGNINLGGSSASERFHIEEGKIFIQAPPLGQGNSSGALLRMGAHPYSAWHAGLGITQGEGVDVYDLDFYTIFGTSTAKMKLTAWGGLGIGVYPLHMLHVNGDVGLGDNSYISTNNGYTRFFTATNGGQGIQAGAIAITDNYSEVAPTNGMYIKGSVGIGTATLPAGAKLAVNGHIYSTKLKVTQTGWPDYVFENDYELSNLQDVEAYIKANKHLPGVLSASDVEKDGLDVGDNQVALLKKIEELTLYIIEMKKQIDKQQKEIGELKQLIEN
jgi:hypothetical protein